jgi:hypothetical protein
LLILDIASWHLLLKFREIILKLNTPLANSCNFTLYLTNQYKSVI